MAETKKPTTKRPLQKKKGPDIKRIIMMIALIIVGAGLIASLYIASGKEKTLTCSGGASLHSFGTCTEQ